MQHFHNTLKEEKIAVYNLHKIENNIFSNAKVM